jgi:hypothetical protein
LDLSRSDVLTRLRCGISRPGDVLYVALGSPTQY